MHKTLIPAALIAGLLVPASAAEAARPGALTDPVLRVEQTSVRMAGRVDPNGELTTFTFQFGTSPDFGEETPPRSAGRGTTLRAVRHDVGGLKPGTLYYYRIVASNASGTRVAPRRTFRTDKVPQSLTISATPNPVRFGSATSVRGLLLGSNFAGRPVQLQAKSFPYSGAFTNVGNAVVTDPTGTFAIPVPGLMTNTEVRVATADGEVRSSPLELGVAPVVRTRVSTSRPRRGSLVRFSGTITPSWVPAEIAVQKLTSDGRWVVVGGTVTRSLDDDRARYSKRVRVPRGGRYRVFVGVPDAKYTATTGLVKRLRVR